MRWLKCSDMTSYVFCSIVHIFAKNGLQNWNLHGRNSHPGHLMFWKFSFFDTIDRNLSLHAKMFSINLSSMKIKDPQPHLGWGIFNCFWIIWLPSFILIWHCKRQRKIRCHERDLNSHLTSNNCIGISSEASPTLWSCYANFSVFIDRIRNQFLKKWII